MSQLNSDDELFLSQLGDYDLLGIDFTNAQEIRLSLSGPIWEVVLTFYRYRNVLIDFEMQRVSGIAMTWGSEYSFGHGLHMLKLDFRGQCCALISIESEGLNLQRTKLVQQQT